MCICNEKAVFLELLYHFDEEMSLGKHLQNAEQKDNDCIRKWELSKIYLFLVLSVTISFGKYRKNSCISRTFLLKFLAQNRGCGLSTRPLHGNRASDRMWWCGRAAPHKSLTSASSPAPSGLFCT